MKIPRRFLTRMVAQDVVLNVRMGQVALAMSAFAKLVTRVQTVANVC